MKHLISIALCAFLLVPATTASEPEPENKPAVGYVAGGAVLCFGGYCVYKLYKTCQRLFPKTTNSPSSSSFSQAGDDEYGASFNYSRPTYCTEEEQDQFAASSDGDKFIASLKVVVDETGSVTSTISAAKALPEQTQTWAEFQAEVASYGLVVNGTGDGSEYFSLNRVPCGPNLVPIVFDEQTQTIVHAGFSGRMRTITIERSKDFRFWSRFMSVTTGYGTGLQVDDLTRSGQMFYRVVVQ